MKKSTTKETWLMTYDEIISNDIIEFGDLIAFKGQTWLEKIEKPENPYYNIGIFLSNEEFLERKNGKTITSKFEKLTRDCVIIKTGTRVNPRTNQVLIAITGNKLRKGGILQHFLSIYEKNNISKLTLAGWIVVFLNNHGYMLTLRGTTPSRLINVLTKTIGRKVIEVES